MSNLDKYGVAGRGGAKCKDGRETSLLVQNQTSWIVERIGQREFRTWST